MGLAFFKRYGCTSLASGCGVTAEPAGGTQSDLGSKITFHPQVNSRGLPVMTGKHQIPEQKLWKTAQLQTPTHNNPQWRRGYLGTICKRKEKRLEGSPSPGRLPLW